MSTIVGEPEPVGLEQLARDVRNAAVSLDVRQARYLVDMYYTMQEHRIALMAQARSMQNDEEPHEAVQFFSRQMSMLERQVNQVLDYWSIQQPLGQWARSQKGIGPVLAAGLLAHIDVSVVETAGHVWSFGGVEPTAKWEKGQKRPWNAGLKLVIWKIGESFMKVSGRENAFYGAKYLTRKQYETRRNDQVRKLPETVTVQALDAAGRGEFVHNGELLDCYRIEDQWYAGGNAKSAWEAITTKKLDKSKSSYKAYREGRIPDSQILARSKRYAAKLFLAHYLEVGRRQLGLPVPKPYPVEHLGHTEVIPPPQ